MHLMIDVSNNNSTPDFVKAKREGVEAVYLKVSEGRTFRDQKYRQYRDLAKKQGLKVGGYHFGHPSNDPKAEARFFLSLLELESSDLLPCLDLEVTDGRSAKQVRQWAKTFLSEIRGTIHASPVIYSGWYFMQDNGLSSLPGPKWVASYGKEPGIRWDAWQYTDRGVCGLDTSRVRDLAQFTFIRRLSKKAQLRFWIRRQRKRGWSWARIKKGWRFKLFKKLGGR